jgi:hypothetical protein
VAVRRARRAAHAARVHSLPDARERGHVEAVGFAELAEPLTGPWTFDGFPQSVNVDGRAFVKATWAAPYPGVQAQYRENVDYHSMHLEVLDDGTWKIDHTDDANPDRGHVLEHAIQDVIPTKVGAVVFTLLIVSASALLAASVPALLQRRRA